MSDSAELHIYDSNNDGGSILVHGSSHYYGGGPAVLGGSLYIHSGSASLIGGERVMGDHGKSFDGKVLDIEGGSLTFYAGRSDSTNSGNVTVSERLHIGSGVAVNVTSNGSIEIGENASAEVEGTLNNSGFITNKGNLINSGNIINNKFITNSGTIINNGTIDNSSILLNIGNGSVSGNTVNGNQPETLGTAFTIEGSDLIYGTDYTYTDGVLTVLSTKRIKIANAAPNTPTTDRIEVAGGVNARITLAGVNIDVSSIEYAAAFKIADNSTGNVTVTLADNSVNILKSGCYCAGLQKNGTSGTLTINGETNGTGRLEATGK